MSMLHTGLSSLSSPGSTFFFPSLFFSFLSFIFFFLSRELLRIFLHYSSRIAWNNFMFLKLDGRKTLLVLRRKTREIMAFSHSLKPRQKELEQKVAQGPRGWVRQADNQWPASRMFDSLCLHPVWGPCVFSQSILARQYLSLSLVPQHLQRCEAEKNSSTGCLASNRQRLKMRWWYSGYYQRD